MIGKKIAKSRELKSIKKKLSGGKYIEKELKGLHELKRISRILFEIITPILVKDATD